MNNETNGMEVKETRVLLPRLIYYLRIYNFFYRSTKSNTYTIQFIESSQRSMLVSKWYLWGNGEISFYNCNFCIFTEIFTNSKFLEHLIVNTGNARRNVVSLKTFLKDIF